MDIPIITDTTPSTKPLGDNFKNDDTSDIGKPKYQTESVYKFINSAM